MKFTKAIKPFIQGKVSAEGLQKNKIDGFLENVGPIWINGWLWDTKSPDEHLDYALVSDGLVVHRGIANEYREDLEDAGIGNGYHGFHIAVPNILFDGQPHQLELIAIESGVVIKGSPQNFTGESCNQTNIQLDGTGLRGSVLNKAGFTGAGELELIEHDAGLGLGSYWIDSGNPDKVDFFVPLPSFVFDGRPHAFHLRTRHEGISFGSTAFIMPNSVPTEDIILKYAREGMKSSLSVQAAQRYESLNQAIIKAAESPHNLPLPLPEYLKQLHRAHNRLVRGFNENDKVFTPLNFAQHVMPDVSIVIPAHNKFYVTYHCLLSLIVAPTNATFEVILVDDGSSDQTEEVPQLISGITYLRNNEAEGFIKSSNLGASHAKGKYVVFLNNDTEVTPGWLDELIVTFNHFDNVGLAGPKLVYPNGQLQEAGGVMWSSGNPWNYGRGANQLDPKFCYTRQVDYLSGACLMIPIELYKEIGGFSEDYLPAYFEDTDLAFEVRKRGFKTVYTPLAQIVHFEGISNGKEVTSGLKKYQEINRPKFKRKWAAEYRNLGKEGVAVDFEKDRGVEFRALVIDAETPMADQTAGSYAAIQEIKILQALGFKCTFMPDNLAWMGTYTEQLQRMGVECVYAPYTSNTQNIIETRGAEFDLIYITRYYVAQKYLDQLRRFAPQAKIVLMLADLHFLREMRAALSTKKIEALAKAAQTRDEELAVLRQVDLVISYTDIEMAVIQSHNFDQTKVAKCPWVVEVAEDTSDFESRRDIAFLGGYGHSPNVEAVEWFVRNVAPILEQSLPDAKFKIYGSKVPKSFEKFTEFQKNVVIGGWVNDVSEVYDTCRVFVTPLQSGAGIKGKVIGALASGVPMVISALAAEGVALQDGTDALVAKTPQEWANKIIELYTDNKLWEKISLNAKICAARNYGMASGVQMMQDALNLIEIYTDKDSNQTLVWS